MHRKDDTSVQNLEVSSSSETRLARLFPFVGDNSTLVLSCPKGDYSASRIAHAVEDCDAHLLNLNVTADRAESDGRLIVELRVSHRSPESVGRSLERYGYEVIDAVGSDDSDDDSLMRSRYEELMMYLGL